MIEEKTNSENDCIITEKDLKKTKNYLQSALKLGIYIESLKRGVEETENMALSVSSPSYLGTKISGSPKNTKENLYVAKIMLEQSINRKLLEFKKRFEEIEMCISSIDDVTIQLLFELRYLQGMKWDDLEYEIALSKRQLFRLHNKALPKIAKYLKEKGLI